ncbi:MAG: glycosyltransferase family 2 protein [Deltaproteobacteria bacterium HGW-Deltaproteobacteria-12]|jgi:glycosyltransferase involved in cell wall biosynthesis|nr:MAG: glycosyltransferase family 2 protein [Deltaproteobacteria bacterium HGW-Deltaproteobacteria-12]
MLGNKTVAVVVPAYNEEKQIRRVVETIPDFVDRIVIVNDCSTDKTAAIVAEYINKNNLPPAIGKTDTSSDQENKYNRADNLLKALKQADIDYFIASQIVNTDPATDRVILINNLMNGGVGSAIARGYKWCRDNNIDCTAVMAGDGQMDPAELASICRPVIEEDIDYVKGNRLIHGSARLIIPKTRFFGNSVLSILTKIASGYWHVSDTQTGYTAISLNALNAIALHDIYKRYGMPNDMLVKLNIAFCTLKEVKIKPVYNIGEISKMKVTRVIPRISWLLFKSFFQRLWVKYLFRDFHPLFLLYHFSFILGLCSIPYVVKIISLVWAGEAVSPVTMLAFFFLFTGSFQSLLFAMWMDIQDNERLYKS